MDLPGMDASRWCRYLPSDETTCAHLLKLARVTPEDVVYDLGCGDGRIVIAAAKLYGARSVGIDVDPQLIRDAKENAKTAGVEHLVRFEQKNLFETDISEATVVALYLRERMTQRLGQKLLTQLRPGSRIVSNGVGIGDWEPDKSWSVPGVPRTLYLWIVPKTPNEIQDSGLYWHYTNGLYIDQILFDGKLKRGMRPGELSIVWFSRKQWQREASFWRILPPGDPGDGGEIVTVDGPGDFRFHCLTQQQTADRFGIYRFGVDRRFLVPWRDGLAAAIHLNQCRLAALNQPWISFSDHPDWAGSFSDVPLERWSCVETWRDRAWRPLDFLRERARVIREKRASLMAELGDKKAPALQESTGAGG